MFLRTNQIRFIALCLKLIFNWYSVKNNLYYFQNGKVGGIYNKKYKTGCKMVLYEKKGYCQIKSKVWAICNTKWKIGKTFIVSAK